LRSFIRPLGAGEHSSVPARFSMRISRLVHTGRLPDFAGISPNFPQLSTAVESLRGDVRAGLLSTAFVLHTPCGQPDLKLVRLYSPAAGFDVGSFL
jgi:hypothetical protein